MREDKKLFFAVFLIIIQRFLMGRKKSLLKREMGIHTHARTIIIIRKKRSSKEIEKFQVENFQENIFAFKCYQTISHSIVTSKQESLKTLAKF